MGSQARALVISQYDEPLEIISWQRAFCLLFSGRARLVDEHDDETVAAGSTHRRRAQPDSTCVSDDSVRAVYRVPAVLRVVTSVAGKPRPIRYSRQNVYARDNFTCAYCGVKAKNTKDLTLDHVLPASRGGKTNWLNVIASCGRCNTKKGARTPEEAGMPLRRKPYRPRWSPAVIIALLNAKVPASWLPYLPAEMKEAFAPRGA